ncbi:MAG: hypothetical protein AAFU73_20155 [Planctomycetota bacterium]
MSGSNDTARTARNYTRADLAQVDPAVLQVDAAARLCGMCRQEWDRLWKSERAPQPIRHNGPRSKPRWSADELRAWIAWGQPPLAQWRKIWSEMLSKGTWATPRLVYLHEVPHAS